MQTPQTPAYQKPLPQPDIDSKEFWDGCKRGELVIQRCYGCHRFRFPPSAVCPECGSWDYHWTPVSGKGALYSFVVIQHPFMRAFVEDLPYPVLQVALEEQEDIRLFGGLAEGNYRDLYVGMPVEVVFQKASEDITLPMWRPAG